MMEPRAIGQLEPGTLDRLLRRGRPGDPDVAATVAQVIDDVRQRGDAALREQALRFDGAALDGLEVPRAAWTEALEALDPELRDALVAAADAIRRFHEGQRPSPLIMETAPGLVLGRRPDPLRRVGVYAPGGRAAYPSSVLMGVVPARVAGVDEVVVCSPAGPDGRPPALVMATCAVAGADRLFAVGGAGAVAAMALGTDTIPVVDRVVGPGNVYVAEAKRQLAAIVGIDSPAGPSELLVIAGAGADPVTIALEMLAQAEHDPDAAAVLVATDRDVAEATARELATRAPREPRSDVIGESLAAAGAILLADSLDEALDFTARYAPEHLLLLVDQPRATLARVRCAGTIFLGARSSVAFGDYATGANHVLPTGGAARFYSGLAVDDFVRWTTWQEVGPAAAPGLAAITVPLASAEGLPAHAAAARRAGRIGPADTDPVDGEDGEDSKDRDAPGAGAGSAPRNSAHDATGERAPVVQPRLPYRSLGLYDPARPPVEVDLSANTNLWGACPPALDALRSSPPPTAYPTPYASDLKAAIAGAWDLEPGQVVTGCGSDDLIDSALRAFCEPGAVVAFPAPTFPMADVFARMNAAEPRPVPLGPDGRLGDGALGILCDADVVYLCRPNNPTGAMIPRRQVEAILDRARGLVLVDEAYGEYAGESLLGLALESRRGVILRTFSKAYGLASLRVGYALGPEPLIRILERSRGPYKVGGQAERAAVAAIREGDGWVTDVVRQTVLNREALATTLRARGLRVIESRANFVLVAPPEWPVGGVDGGVDGGMDGHLDGHMDGDVDGGVDGDMDGGVDGTGSDGPGWAQAVRSALLQRGILVRAFPALEGVGEAVRVTVAPEPIMERFLLAFDEARREIREVA
jgi:histidinol dehydrogenase